MTDQRWHDERLLISVPEAAARLGIGITKAWELARRNELPGLVRVGTRSVRVSVDALREWVAAEAATPTRVDAEP